MTRRASASVRRAAAAATCVAASLASTAARAATANWTNPAGGAFSLAANWNSGAGPAPAAGTDIVFALPDAYTVSFTINPPAAGQTNVNDGDVTFVASGAARTAASNIWSRVNNGATLTLGAAGAPVLTYNPWNFAALPGGSIFVRHGTKVNTGPGGAGAGGGPTASATPAIITVDGAGSTLGGSSGIGAGTVGNATGPATVGIITYSNNATGTFAGGIGVSNGLFSIETGADLVTQGPADIGSIVGFPPITPGATATFNVTGPGSTLTQTGTGGITVGSAHGNASALNIADGGSVTTPGITINSSGVIDFTGGTLNTKAGVLVNGGTLRRTAVSGSYVPGSNASMTVQGGGKIDLAGAFDLLPPPAFSATLTVKDANSEFKTTGQLRTHGATVKVQAGGRIAAPSMLIEGTTTIDGAGASLVTTAGGGGVTTSAFGSTLPNVVFKNGATGTIDGPIAVTAGETRVESGADLVVTGAIDLTSGTARRLTVTGAGSTLVQTGAAPVNVSGPSLAVFLAEGGGAITTGAGLLTISNGGQVGANGGTFHHGGDIAVTSSAALGLTSWAPGRTMTVNTGGRVALNDVTLSRNTINAAGPDSVVGGNVVTLNGGTAMTFFNTHWTSRFTRLHLATDGTSACIHVAGDSPIDPGQITTGGPPFPYTPNIWGANGGTVNVTIGQRGVAKIDNGFELASTGVNTTGTVDVAGTLYTPYINAQNDTTSGGSATINVTGLLGNLAYSPSLIGGAAGSGTATVNVNGGGSFQSGAGTVFLRPSATLNVNGGAAAIDALTINGGKLNLNGGSLLTGPALAITDGGRLDVNDNAFVVRAGNVGAFDGTAYDGVSGLIASGYNYSAWDGSGIVTSEFDAGDTRSVTSIAVATADQVFRTGTLFAGRTLAADDVIVMYTYAGDANLDGLIDAADYGFIDNFVQFPGSYAWTNGDFNYDGVIDAADYGIIDNSIQLQGAPFGTDGGAVPAPMTGVTAVPEPSACYFAMLAAATLIPRGRRRRRRQGN